MGGVQFVSFANGQRSDLSGIDLIELGRERRRLYLGGFDRSGSEGDNNSVRTVMPLQVGCHPSIEVENGTSLIEGRKTVGTRNGIHPNNLAERSV